MERESPRTWTVRRVVATDVELPAISRLIGFLQHEDTRDEMGDSGSLDLMPGWEQEARLLGEGGLFRAGEPGATFLGADLEYGYSGYAEFPEEALDVLIERSFSYDWGGVTLSFSHPSDPEGRRSSARVWVSKKPESPMSQKSAHELRSGIAVQAPAGSTNGTARLANRFLNAVGLSGLASVEGGKEGFAVHASEGIEVYERSRRASTPNRGWWMTQPLRTRADPEVLTIVVGRSWEDEGSQIARGVLRFDVFGPEWQTRIVSASPYVNAVSELARAVAVLGGQSRPYIETRGLFSAEQIERLLPVASGLSVPIINTRLSSGSTVEVWATMSREGNSRSKNVRPDLALIVSRDALDEATRAVREALASSSPAPDHL